MGEKPWSTFCRSLDEHGTIAISSCTLFYPFDLSPAPGSMPSSSNYPGAHYWRLSVPQPTIAFCIPQALRHSSALYTASHTHPLLSLSTVASSRFRAFRCTIFRPPLLLYVLPFPALATVISLLNGLLRPFGFRITPQKTDPAISPLLSHLMPADDTLPHLSHHTQSSSLTRSLARDRAVPPLLSFYLTLASYFFSPWFSVGQTDRRTDLYYI